MEFTILNLTDKIDKMQNTTNVALFIYTSHCILLPTNPLCIIYNTKISIFKASNSTKSQLHQPPQESSCSAHQPPNKMEIRSIKAVFNKPLLKSCRCIILL